jgi:hypothetical protein
MHPEQEFWADHRRWMREKSLMSNPRPVLSEAAKVEAQQAVGRLLDGIRKAVISFLDEDGREIIWIHRECMPGDTITVVAPSADNIEVI